jgi:hypothetical protein
MRKLCEIQQEMREPLLEIGLRELEGYRLLRKWASMKCPHRNHCDPATTKKCDGLTPQNLVTISKLQDELFFRGYVRTTEEK